MGADHDLAINATGLGGGEQVRRRHVAHDLGRRRHADGYGPGDDLVVELLADGEARADHRDRRQIIRGEGAGERLLTAGLPSLKMTAASYPAAWALSALMGKSQVPRWISATCGSVVDAGVKSPGSQPLSNVLARGPGG